MTSATESGKGSTVKTAIFWRAPFSKTWMSRQVRPGTSFALGILDGEGDVDEVGADTERVGRACAAVWEVGSLAAVFGDRLGGGGGG